MRGRSTSTAARTTESTAPLTLPTLRATEALPAARRSATTLFAAATTRSAESAATLFAAGGATTTLFTAAWSTELLATVSAWSAKLAAGSTLCAARKTGIIFVGGQLAVFVLVEILEEIAGGRFDLGRFNGEVVVLVDRRGDGMGWGTATTTPARATELSALTTARTTLTAAGSAKLSALVTATWSAKTLLLGRECRDRQGESGRCNCERKFHGFDRVIGVCGVECEFNLRRVCKAGRS